VAFLVPSLHDGAWHTDATQTPLAQSPAKLHAVPSGQPTQLPPQSTADSLPFWTVSLQVGAAQTFAVQI
jgi:hypothetical protein